MLQSCYNDASTAEASAFKARDDPTLAASTRAVYIYASTYAVSTDAVSTDAASTDAASTYAVSAL